MDKKPRKAKASKGTAPRKTAFSRLENEAEVTSAPAPFALAMTADFRKQVLHLMGRMVTLLAGEGIVLPEQPEEHLPGASESGLDAGINAALAETGRMLGVSRAYVMLDEDGGRYLRNTHEWVDGSIGPAMYSWPLHDYERDLPSLKPLMEGKDFFPGHTREMPLDMQRTLTMQAVDSVLLVPLLRDGTWIGLAGFDSCGREREWREEEVLILRHLARLVVLFLERREYLDTRRTLDGIRAFLDGSTPPARKRSGLPAAHARPPDVPEDALSLQEAERRLIMEVLIRYKGNKTRAARHLGLTWAALDRRCKKLGIETDKTGYKG